MDSVSQGQFNLEKRQPGLNSSFRSKLTARYNCPIFVAIRNINSVFSSFTKKSNFVRPKMSLFSFRYYKWLRLGLLIGTDALIIIGSFWLAYVIRLESINVAKRFDDFRQALPIFMIVHIFTFYVGGMYRQVWRYANFNSALLIARLTFIATTSSTLLVYTFDYGRVPRSIPIIFWLVMTMGVTLVKFSWRVYTTARTNFDGRSKERCVVYGAGSAGELLARHVQADPHFPYKIVGFIDDDKNKKNRIVHGLKIFGTGSDLESITTRHNVQTVVIAIHAAPGSIIRSVVENCRKIGLKSVIMPDMANSLENDVFRPRKIDIKDLLRRAPKEIDKDSVKKLVHESTVLVTGAGGSIGSEIARQILSYAPRKLLLLDNTEFNLYRIEQELRDSLNSGLSCIEIVPVLGSASDNRVVETLFHRHEPQYVLHAAAYKHVPMVEANPSEGVINNILSTKLLAEAAIKYHVKKFLLISTDKSVRPTNIMGATKRCCELLIQAISATAPLGNTCNFCAVRFGNVLGSSGSVVPRFLEQIQAGGPVTVTHPEVTRYFMLTSEAVALVLQSIAMARGGEIFVLNMGSPIKIYEMAKQLIWLSGRKPETDIEIRFTGLRPGEKLYEELTIEGTEQRTLHEDVFVAKSQLSNPREMLIAINKAIDLALQGNATSSLELVKQLASWTASSASLEPQDTPNHSALH